MPVWHVGATFFAGRIPPDLPYPRFMKACRSTFMARIAEGFDPRALFAPWHAGSSLREPSESAARSHGVGNVKPQPRRLHEKKYSVLNRHSTNAIGCPCGGQGLQRLNGFEARLLILLAWRPPPLNNGFFQWSGQTLSGSLPLRQGR